VRGPLAFPAETQTEIVRAGGARVWRVSRRAERACYKYHALLEIVMKAERFCALS
jgi:hypothetical protein